MKTQEQIINELKRLAHARGTQKALAREIGISEVELTKVIRGAVKPTPKVREFLSIRPEVVYIPMQ